MKIRKLKIKNYKVFDDVEFDFTDKDGNALDTVVLAGVNGTEKTTVLEFIFNCICQSNSELDKQKDIHAELEFDVTDNSLMQLIKEKVIKPEVIDKERPLLLRLESLSEINDFNLFPLIRTLVYLPVKKKMLSSKLNKTGVYILHLDSHKSQMEKSVLKSVQSEVFKNRNYTLNDSIKKSIAKISYVLRGLKLSSKLVDLDNDSLIFESANGKRITFENLSNGEQNLYFRAIQLSHLDIKDGLILIDEPEDALHPTWQKEVAKLYQNVGENNQVIMATHSPHVMASVEPKSLFVLHINKESQKIEVINMEKIGKHTKGLEPNRILREVMELDVLRDYDVQYKIDELSKQLTINEFEKIETQELINTLTDTLGKEDPFIIRMAHQLLMLNRQKMKLADFSPSF